VDLATGGAGARQASLLHPRAGYVAARLADGRNVCAGGHPSPQTAEAYESATRVQMCWECKLLPAPEASYGTAAGAA